MKVFVSEEEAKLHKVAINRLDDLVIIRCSNKKLARKMKDLVKTFLIAQTNVDDGDDEEESDIEISKEVVGFKG